MHMNTYFYTYIIYLYTLYHMKCGTYPGIYVHTSTTSPDLAHIHTSTQRERRTRISHDHISSTHTNTHIHTHITSHHIHTERTR